MEGHSCVAFIGHCRLCWGLGRGVERKSFLTGFTRFTGLRKKWEYEKKEGC